ncbi:hypothetical protein RKD55_004714 [Rossellomorea marisflavi]
MKITVYERLMFLAMGGRRQYRHNNHENKQTTKLQNFLDTVTK